MNEKQQIAMTVREKALELVDKFYQRLPLQKDVMTAQGDLSWKYDNWYEAKQCALIAVDEIISYCHTEHIKFYIEVKEELNKL